MGRDLKLYVVYTVKQTTKTRYFCPLVLFLRSRFSKKASLSPIFVEQAGAYSKPLVMIEAPLHVQLQLLVTAYLSIKNEHSSCSSMPRALFGAQSA